MREGETDEQFHARVGAELDALIDEYTAWNKANGLDLGSADDHLFDENLTPEQRAWIQDFSNRWEDTEYVYNTNGPFQRKEKWPRD